MAHPHPCLLTAKAESKWVGQQFSAPHLEGPHSAQPAETTSLGVCATRNKGFIQTVSVYKLYYVLLTLLITVLIISQIKGVESESSFSPDFGDGLVFDVCLNKTIRIF